VLLVHEQARAGAAALALVEENRVRRARNSVLEVRVLQNDVG
jgi:hypothetical protein